MSRLRLRLKGGSLLATPTLTNFSALGSAPLTLQWSTSDYVAGMRAQLEIATDSLFASITQNIIFFIDGASWALNDEAINLATPSGTYFARIRTTRDNESGTLVTGNDAGAAGAPVSFNADVSAWSTTFTDTINASVAALNTITGTNKSQFTTVTGTPALTFSGASGNDKDCVRTTIEQASAKAQFEITVNSGATTDFVVGVEDGTTDLNTLVAPGYSNSAGIAVEFFSGAQISIDWNARGNQTNLINTAGTIANGDIFTIVIDTTNHTIDVYRTRAGTTVQMGAQATGLPTLSHYFGFAGTINATAGGTMNYGGTTYAKAPGAGVAAIWA